MSPPPTRASQITVGILLVVAILLLFSLVYPLWKPLLLGSVLAGALHGWHQRLTARLRKRPNLSATLITAGVVLLILAPVSGIVYIAVREALQAIDFVRTALASGGTSSLLARLPEGIEDKLRQALNWLPGGLEWFARQLASGGQAAASAVGTALTTSGHILFALAIMLIAFYFLLVEGDRLIHWMADKLPLRESVTRKLLREVKITAQSLLRTTLATAAAQSLVATIGYLIAQVPQAFFFGLLTFFAAFIPSVGTAIVALPLCVLLFLIGHPWAALFLLIWSIVVVGLVDNLMRPLLLRGGMRLHGALVFFSLIGGVALMGGVGLVAGPLILTFFISMMRLSQQTFDNQPVPAEPREPPPTAG